MYVIRVCICYILCVCAVALVRTCVCTLTRVRVCGVLLDTPRHTRQLIECLKRPQRHSSFLRLRNSSLARSMGPVFIHSLPPSLARVSAVDARRCDGTAHLKAPLKK
eukprot:GHVU01195390.1.p1 GENE.GHVU01195390.1~~GHVU01195390.1.p1  ORF type:complete len:107 (+),score=3.44 GHVU01195390.1:296-616(+)